MSNPPNTLQGGPHFFYTRRMLSSDAVSHKPLPCTAQALSRGNAGFVALTRGLLAIALLFCLSTGTSDLPLMDLPDTTLFESVDDNGFAGGAGQHPDPSAAKSDLPVVRLKDPSLHRFSTSSEVSGRERLTPPSRAPPVPMNFACISALIS